MPKWVIAPPLAASMTMAPVPAKTRQNVPKISARHLRGACAAELGQAAAFAGHGGIGGHGGAQALHHGARGGMGMASPGVVHPFALAPGRDQAVPPEIGEMPGDRWLRHVEDRHEMADADLAAGEEIKNPEPGGVREAEEKGSQCKDLWRHGARNIYGKAYM